MPSLLEQPVLLDSVEFCASLLVCAAVDVTKISRSVLSEDTLSKKEKKMVKEKMINNLI